MINQEKLNQFMAAYEPALKTAVINHPDEYTWPIDHLPVVVARMRAAIEHNSFSNDGFAFKGACKALGIKCTYKAISQFLERN